MGGVFINTDVQADVVMYVLSKNIKDTDGIYFDLKKYKNQALQEARSRVRAGAVKDGIDLTVSPRQFYIEDREWEAIQAGAFTNSKLTAILNEADENRVKELATPRSATKMTTSQINKAKQRLNAGRTQAEVADSLGVSVTTLNKAIAE